MWFVDPLGSQAIGRRGLKNGPTERSAMKKKHSRRIREQFWQKTFGEHADSGQSVQAFCRERRLDESEFYYWQQQLRYQCRENPSTESAAFQECGAESSATATATLLECDAENSDPQTDWQAMEQNDAPCDSAGHCSASNAVQEDVAPPPAPRARKRPKVTTISMIGREERYRLADTTGVSVEIGTDSDAKRTKNNVELVDISKGGVRLRSESPLNEKDELTLTIVPEGFPKSLSVCAQVCWTTPAPKGLFYSGCSIEPKIPQALLDHLSAKGILERRHDTRQGVSLVLPACWELNPKRFEVSVLNVSHGGICLSISQDGKPGDRIRLTLPGDPERPTYLLLTVCWEVSTAEGYVVGCKFCQPSGYEKLRHLADAQDAQSIGRFSGDPRDAESRGCKSQGLRAFLRKVGFRF
jgi:hypothetical protein